MGASEQRAGSGAGAGAAMATPAADPDEERMKRLMGPFALASGNYDPTARPRLRPSASEPFIRKNPLREFESSGHSPLRTSRDRGSGGGASTARGSNGVSGRVFRDSKTKAKDERRVRRQFVPDTTDATPESGKHTARGTAARGRGWERSRAALRRERPRVSPVRGSRRRQQPHQQQQQQQYHHLSAGMVAAAENAAVCEVLTAACVPAVASAQPASIAKPLRLDMSNLNIAQPMVFCRAMATWDLLPRVSVARTHVAAAAARHSH